MNNRNYFLVPVDIRNIVKMSGPEQYICTNMYGTCMNYGHDHPATYVRIPVIFGELVIGDPTMDGCTY